MTFDTWFKKEGSVMVSAGCSAEIVASAAWTVAGRDIALLRSALVGLIGVDTESELRQMAAVMRLVMLTSESEADKTVVLDAIHALLETMAPNQDQKGE